MINTNKVMDNLKFLGLFVAAMIITAIFMTSGQVPEWLQVATIVAAVAVVLGVNIVYDLKFGPARGKKWSFEKPTDTRHRVQVTDLHHGPADRLEIHGIMPGTGTPFEATFTRTGKKWVHSSGWDGNLNDEAAPDEVKVEVSADKRTYLQTEVWEKWECPSTATGTSEEPHQHTDECFMEASKKRITWHIGKNS
mgnify:FL=1|jgi:hypothetical protein